MLKKGLPVLNYAPSQINASMGEGGKRHIRQLTGKDLNKIRDNL